MNTKGIILSTKYGDINGDYNLEKVTLIGYPLEEGVGFISKLELLIEGENLKESFKIQEEGYEFKLFLINTTNNNIDKILIIGDYGGSGGYIISNLYKYKENKLKFIFSNKTFKDKYIYESIFLPDYKAVVISKENKKKYIIDIKNKGREYLDLIYDKDGNILPYINPEVSSINSIFPIQLTFNNYYSLLVYQRIIGVVNSDTLGWIQTTIDIYDDGNIKTIYQYIGLYGDDFN